MRAPLELYRLELSVYGALHIGTGENFPAYAYVPDERAGRVYLLDTTALLGLLNAKEQQEFIRRVEASPKQAQSSLKALWERDAARLQSALIREVEASKAFFGTLANADRDLAAAEFRPLPVSLSGPYIPGSSLKGALRTAWLADLASKELETADLATTGNRGWQRQAPLILKVALSASKLGRQPDSRRDSRRSFSAISTTAAEAPTTTAIHFGR